MGIKISIFGFAFWCEESYNDVNINASMLVIENLYVKGVCPALENITLVDVILT